MPNDPLHIAPEGPAGPVPALVFVPEDPPSRLPLVLLGHGAHLGKDDETMQLLCRALASVPAAVAIMDAPGHGERRTPHLGDAEWEADVLQRMGDPAVHAQLRAEWPLVVAAARARLPAASGPVAYAGFSMGSIFGLSIVGDLAEVRAAVFAVGGYLTEERDTANAVNDLVASGITRLGEREVLMVNMTRDESFPIGRAIEVLETIPGRCSMHVYVGGHRDLPPAAMSGMLRFLRRVLAD
jgi:dienelactone hydrolase